MPVTARTRPPRNGPMRRHFIPLSESSLSVCAAMPAALPTHSRRAADRIETHQRPNFILSLPRLPGGFYRERWVRASRDAIAELRRAPAGAFIRRLASARRGGLRSARIPKIDSEFGVG